MGNVTSSIFWKSLCEIGFVSSSSIWSEEQRIGNITETADLNPNVTIIALNVNGPSAPIKAIQWGKEGYFNKWS